MDKHNGLCRKLVEALQQLMPNKLKLGSHKTGPDEECSRALTLQLVKLAATESHLSTEHVIACQQVSEIFKPIPGDDIKTYKRNQFVYLLINQCQIYLTTIRKSKFVYKSHDDFVKHEGELKAEKNPEVYKRLKNEHVDRFKSRELAIGTIKFIAQLYLVGCFTSRIMELCMKDLLNDNPTELDIECFCVFLSTIGAELETSSKGSDVIDKYLGVLEQIVDKYVGSFVLRVRCMILKVFELRANNWQLPHPEQKPPTATPENKVEDATEVIVSARETREFLNEFKDVLCKLRREKLLDFMYWFMGMKNNKEQLEGTVKIIFERAISSQDTSMFALVCKGLADNTTIKTEDLGDRVMLTFKEYLLKLVLSEIENVRSSVTSFNSIPQRLEALKIEGEKQKLEKSLSAIEKDFEVSSRVVNVAEFIGELFNVNFIGSRFVFDEVFSVLVNKKFISNASIEAFCKLLKVAGTKMVTEKNQDVLLKDRVMDLVESSKTIEIFPKTKFMIREIITFSRYQLKLCFKDTLKDEIASYAHFQFPWKSTLFIEPSWVQDPKKMKQPNANKSEGNKSEFQRPSTCFADYSGVLKQHNQATK